MCIRDSCTSGTGGCGGASGSGSPFSSSGSGGTATPFMLSAARCTLNAIKKKVEDRRACTQKRPQYDRHIQPVQQCEHQQHYKGKKRRAHRNPDGFCTHRRLYLHDIAFFPTIYNIVTEMDVLSSRCEEYMDFLLKNHADCLSGKHLDQNGETSENGGLLRRRKEFHDMHAPVSYTHLVCR